MIGNQEPRIGVVPDGVDHPDGAAALELVEAAGLHLDPWQRHVLGVSLRQRDGKWAAFEVALVCPRQNGKNALIEARELAGLFVLGERLIIHSAHLADTSREAFRRLEELIDANEWLSREVKHVWRTNGHESIELRTGQRVRFRTRTKGGGRGFSGDCVIFDEAMILPEASHAAILPVVSARPNPQVWYTGSAVDQLIHEDGVVLARVRERGLSGDDPSLAYMEWSLDHAKPDEVPVAEAAGEEAWAAANPALGIRISPGHVANEQRSMDPRTFAVERLGVGDWPAVFGSSVIDLHLWASLVDGKSQPRGPLVFAFDVSPDRAWASICVSGQRPDGLPHIEVMEHRRGTGWVVPWLTERVARHKPLAVVCDGASPAGSLIPDLERAKVDVDTVTGGEYAAGCGIFYDAVQQERLRHLGTPELDSAVRGASTRPLGDSWAWSRKNSGVNITPLVGCTLALWGLSTKPPKGPPRVIDLGDL